MYLSQIENINQASNVNCSISKGPKGCASFLKAFDNGYRSIDTAIFYKTEEGVGNALEILFKQKGVKRDEIFITTKVWPTDNSFEKVRIVNNTSFKMSFNHFNQENISFIKKVTLRAVAIRNSRNKNNR